MSPPSNSFLAPEALDKAEIFYPLHAFVCSNCLLVQLEEFESPQKIFEDYAYFSSFSTSWLAHCSKYVDDISQRLALDAGSQVVEIASNDGYLLRFFNARGIRTLGIEPAQNVAEVARASGVETLVEFFGSEMAAKVSKSHPADLIVANNVLAHVPDVNDFTAGLKLLLRDSGTITVEFPHIMRLIEFNQFDTIYHEHFSYFSMLTLMKIFEAHNLRIYDVEELPTHGGSLRIYVGHPHAHSVSQRVELLLKSEREAGLDRIDTYRAFSAKVSETKRRLLQFLLSEIEGGKKFAGYGAAAKGTTLLNYCGIRSDMLDFIVDKNPRKQGRYLPGCHIEISAPDRIFDERPDYILILPWNIRREIIEEMSGISEWGGRFVVPIPRIEVIT